MASTKIRDDEGTITISVTGDCVRLYDSCNSFDCSIDKSHLKEFVKIIKRFKKPLTWNKAEMHSTEVVNKDWFHGNFVVLKRLKRYVEVLEGMSIDKAHTQGNLKRMTTKNLINLYYNLEINGTIIKELRKEGSR